MTGSVGAMAGLRSGVSVVVPVFRSSPTLARLVDELSRALAGADHEIILVDDGSPDDSWATIQRLAGDHPTVHGLRLTRNFGQHNALIAGVRAARFDITVTVDDDLQHPPSEIPKLLAALDDEVDVVYGTPIQRAHDRWRVFASTITKTALRSAMGSETAQKVSAFRAFRTRLRRAFAGYHGPHVSIDVLLTWGSTRFTSVDVRHDERLHGRSNYTLRKLASHALNMVTGYSTLPLQVATYTGFAFAAFGVGVLFWVIGRTWINGGSVPGFPFLASTLAIFSGVQLFALGIIGEYLARMHFRLMQKPTFVVAEHALGADHAPEPADER